MSFLWGILQVTSPSVNVNVGVAVMVLPCIREAPGSYLSLVISYLVVVRGARQLLQMSDGLNF